MAVTPLFNPDMDTLKSKLRLSGAGSADALAIIDQKVQEVRVGFYDHLGATRVAQIVAISLTDTPTDTDGILRLKAAVTEVNWVKMLLYRALPTLFMDNSAVSLEVWNEEGLTREGGKSDKELARMQAEINEALEDLGGTGDVGMVTAAVIESDTTPVRPGDSIRHPWQQRGDVSAIYPTNPYAGSCT